MREVVVVRMRLKLICRKEKALARKMNLQAGIKTKNIDSPLSDR